MCSGEGTVFSERTVQGVVVVFEVLQLQEVPGPLAPLLHCWGVVVALGGGGRGGGAGGLRDAGQVFGRRLVALAWRAAVARLDAENNGGRVQAGNTAQLTFQDGISINGKLWRMKQSSLTHWPVQLELGGTSKILLHQKPADRTGANTHTAFSSEQWFPLWVLIYSKLHWEAPTSAPCRALLYPSNTVSMRGLSRNKQWEFRSCNSQVLRRLPVTAVDAPPISWKGRSKDITHRW